MTGDVEVDVIHDEALPEWAMEAIANGESVTLRGLHRPAEDPGGHGAPGGAAAAPNVARTTTPVHPNCRSSHVRVNGEDVGKASEINISVDGDLTEGVRRGIKKAAEEAMERSKRLVPR